MGEPMDERYATFREHAELRERTATLEETVRQVGPSLNRIETMIVAQKTSPQPPQETAAALALHRALDAFDKKGGTGVGTMILIGFAMFGVGVACFLIGKVFF
jgi:hypothetical protein